MEFTNINFLFVVLPVIVFLYYMLSRWVKAQNVYLLVCSLIFYSSFGIYNLLWLVIATLITYFGAWLGSVALSNSNEIKWMNRIINIAICANIGILVLFKAYDFIINSVVVKIGCIQCSTDFQSILLPIGMSFYAFQSTSYLIDVKRGKISYEKNIIDYALYVAFFPTVISGPIQRSDKLLRQIKRNRELNIICLEKGFITLLYGLFLKWMIADRIAIYTNKVFGDTNQYKGVYLIIAIILYSVQIYADFAGYTYLAIAIARMLGFELVGNFNRPYLAKGFVDFWRRWHISLTSWLRDYIYIPLGGNRKGTNRKYFNILVVFLISGIWHGTSWNYVIWGIIHGGLQVLELSTEAIRDKLSKILGYERTSVGHRVFSSIVVYLVCSIVWVFFRIDSVSKAVSILASCCKDINPWVIFDGSLLGVGLSYTQWVILFCSILVLLVISLLQEKNCSLVTWEAWSKQRFLPKVIQTTLCVFILLIFGVYGSKYSSTGFIYANF